MVTCVPGNNSCTACAITWAQSCRISSTPSSSSAVMTASSQLRSISVAKSTTVPSILSASAFLPDFGNRRSKFHTGHRRFHIAGGPSGRVSVIMCVFRFLCQNHKSPGAYQGPRKSQQARGQNRVRHPHFLSDDNAKCGGKKARNLISGRVASQHPAHILSRLAETGRSAAKAAI